MNEGDAAFGRLQQYRADIGPMVDDLNQRAEDILRALGRMLPFESGWLAVRDAERRRHVPLATTGEAEPWRFRGGVAGALFTSTGRHVGFLSLLAEDPERPGPADRRLVAAVSRVIADDLDRTRQIATAARIVGSAEAGVVLTRGGNVLALPGLPGDRRLVSGSPILAAAARELSAGGPYTAFLVPTATPDGERLARVTAVDCAVPELDHLSAAVLLSSPGDLRGLTPLDLRVLGHLVAGTTQVPALAAALHVDPGTTTEALRRAQVALHARSVTAAATRAVRTGLRIPPALSHPA